ncbi:Ribonuclease H-like superfamily [Sesbania bispinosa]|nr:Ribonuclease H-like superfamily [Sesbania bispinosa]
MERQVSGMITGWAVGGCVIISLSGIYTPRSAYIWLLQQFYVVATDWVRDNIKEDEISFLAILWKIWCARNQATFDQKETSGWETIYASVAFANTIRKVYGSASDAAPSVPQMIGWSAPSQNQVAVNTDGSVMDGRAGFGGLLRTSTGNWIQGFCGFLGEKDISLRRAPCYFEGFAIVLESSVEEYRVKHMLSRDWSVELVHVFREGNNTADILAKQGVIQTVPFVLLNDPPSHVLHSLQADALGVLFPRV